MNNFRAAILSGNGPRPKDFVLPDKEARGAEAEALGPVETPRDKEHNANHRDEERHQLSGESAIAKYEGKPYDVELINLSGGGAMIRGTFRPRLWDRVELTLGEGSAIEGAVRWLRDDRIGLEFAHETHLDCDPKLRDELLLAVIQRSVPMAEARPQRDAAGPDGAADGTDADNRGERRHPLIWSGSIHYNQVTTPVRLRNISSSGALIECTATLHAGGELLLDLGEAGSLFATINWVAGDQAGLKFKEQFDLGCLARARPTVAPPRWERPAYLNPASPADSPWARQWQRIGVDDLRDELEGFMKR